MIPEGNPCPLAGGELHDGLHDVVVVLAKSSHGLALGALHLGHDELDVLRLDASLVDLTLVRVLDDKNIRLGVTCAGLLREACSTLRLRLGAEVLDLGLAEDDVGVGVRRLVHVRLGDNEENVLALLHRDAGDARQGLHAKLGDGLAALLLGPVLLSASAGAARSLRV